MFQNTCGLQDPWKQQWGCSFKISHFRCLHPDKIHFILKFRWFSLRFFYIIRNRKDQLLGVEVQSQIKGAQVPASFHPRRRLVLCSGENSFVVALFCFILFVFISVLLLRLWYNYIIVPFLSFLQILPHTPPCSLTNSWPLSSLIAVTGFYY